MTTSTEAYVATNLLTTRRIDIWRESLAGIGRFEVQLENQGNTYGGTIDSQNAVELKINTVSMMKGYVDDVLPNVDDPTAVYRNLMKVVGRDYGQDLANLFLTKEYADQKFDDIIDDALAEAGGTGTAEITYASPATGEVIDYSFKNQHLLDGFKEIVKLVDADFYADDSKALQLFLLSAAASSGVTLKAVAGASDNNILVLKEIGEKVGFDIRNYIQVQSGDVDDHWTEGNASDFVGNFTSAIINDTATKLYGGSSIKATVAETTIGYDSIASLQFPLYTYDELDFSQVESSDCTVFMRQDWEDNPLFSIYLLDDEGNIIKWATNTIKGYNVWAKFVFPCGIGNEIAEGSCLNQWYYWSKETTFTWKITKIYFGFYGYLRTGAHYWVDGLKLPGITATAIADEGTPWGGHRKRMIPLSRTDLKSQVQLQDLANSELAHRKDPTQKLSVTSTFQSGCKYAGQTVMVTAPSSGIGLAGLTATSNGAVGGTTVIDSSRIEADDYWNNSYIKMTSGTCSGEIKKVTDFDNATHTFTTEAFSAQIDSGDTYMIQIMYRILSLHHVAESKQDLLRGHDALTEFELIKHETASVQPTDPLRFKMTRNPQWTYIQRLEERIRNLERG